MILANSVISLTKIILLRHSREHVRVVKELPEVVLLRFNRNISSKPNMRTKACSSPNHYKQKVLSKLLELGVVRIAPFSNRLARSVPSNIRALRCLVNYQALRFAEPIRTLAEDMVDRTIKKSSLTDGKYVSVHLRFEEDMVAFSCCTYDGGWKEKIEMENARERSWKGKFRRPGRVINPEANRSDGKCPLTLEEIISRDSSIVVLDRRLHMCTEACIQYFTLLLQITFGLFYRTFTFFFYIVYSKVECSVARLTT